jgi:predicted CXXCH cytochrome family protein
VEGGAALVAAKNKSFDLNCAGCHFTGGTLKAEAVTGNFQADAANDPNGPIDYDGDGTRDEIVIGCEACHGPGSAHASAPGRGKSIVQPAFLSAERENQLCGNCHTRGVGKGTIGVDHSEYPSKGADAAITFAYPGMSRAEFVADYHTDVLGTWNDDKKHSRQHHQQFNDLLKSKHTKNPFDLLSCSNCHNMHDRLNGPSLSVSNADNKLCLGCHAPFGFGLGFGTFTKEAEGLAVSRHMVANAGMVSGYDPVTVAIATATGGVGRCSGCHMPKTAASQSRFLHEQVSLGLQPTGPRIRGDVSSHFFDVIWPAQSEVVFDNFTSNNQLSNSCGSCHNRLAPGAAAPAYTW